MKNHHHTLVDHRPGGPRVSFGVGAWCAVDVARVRADRADASISAYETLLEQLGTGESARQSSAVMRSTDHRRVVTIVEVRGHGEFGHLASAWDDHRLYREHRANAESVTLALYRVIDAAGDARIDPASPDRYEIEAVAQPAARVTKLLEPLESTAGFRGALVLGSGDEKSSLIVYRFEHEADFETFRASTAALASLGPIGTAGETLFAVHPVRTFGTSA